MLLKEVSNERGVVTFTSRRDLIRVVGEEKFFVLLRSPDCPVSGPVYCGHLLQASSLS